MAMPALRPYQVEPLRAIVGSVLWREGRTFTVMMSRQAGKNELSAQLEVALLTLFGARGGDGVKASPTFVPQTRTSIDRLTRRLADAGLGGHARTEFGRDVRLGRARLRFFSAAPAANVVGATASLILEIDEAQDIDPAKYQRDFRPMGATANVTTVLYGTAWDDRTLLDQTIQENLELERRDGVRRHFAYDWHVVARHNPAYRAFVEAERDRLGEDHPLFRTQYALRPIAGEGRAFPAPLRAQLEGDHTRQLRPTPGRVYVAGVDLAGEAEGPVTGRRDSTVVTIVETSSQFPVPSSQETKDETPAFSRPLGTGNRELGTHLGAALPPSSRVVFLARRTGVAQAALFGWLVDLLGTVWDCRRIVVDATGVGAGVASFLREALGGRVLPFVFTAQSKSALAYRLLAAANAGRLKLYAGSDEDAVACRAEIALARSVARPNGLLNLFVEPAEGHDDYLMSLALAVEAAEGYRPRGAVGR